MKDETERWVHMICVILHTGVDPRILFGVTLLSKHTFAYAHAHSHVSVWPYMLFVSEQNVQVTILRKFAIFDYKKFLRFIYTNTVNL